MDLYTVGDVVIVASNHTVMGKKDREVSPDGEYSYFKTVPVQVEILEIDGNNLLVRELNDRLQQYVYVDQLHGWEG